MSRTFTVFIAAALADGSHNKRYAARIGKTSSNVVTITDNSEGLTSASYAANISFTSTVVQMSKLTFFSTYYSLYRVGVSTACSVPSQNVAVTGVMEVGSSIAVKTSIYTTAEESTDKLIAVLSTAFVQTVSSITAQNSSTAVSLTTSKAQVSLNCNAGVGAEWIAAVGCRCQMNFFGNGSLLQCQPCPFVNGTIQTFSEPGSTECVVRKTSRNTSK
jgi:hypothetical protein